MATCSQVLLAEGKPYPRTCAVHGLSCPKPEVDDRMPIAATDGRPVDYVDVTGWGVFNGHVIPVGVARLIAEKINLYAEHRETTLRQRIEELTRALADAVGFVDRASGVALGVAMSGKDHPNPDGALVDLSREGMAISSTARAILSKQGGER